MTSRLSEQDRRALEKMKAEHGGKNCIRCALEYAGAAAKLVATYSCAGKVVLR